VSVVDASVVVNGLTRDDAHGAVVRRELRRSRVLQVPSHFPAEVTSGIRKLVLRRRLDVAHASAARRRLHELRVIRYPFEPFEPRIWELRHDLSVYDAWYVALAEVLETELVTADARLARTPHLRCEVRLVGA
jgi:predicted nucleic acid-binding protein